MPSRKSQKKQRGGDGGLWSYLSGSKSDCPTDPVKPTDEGATKGLIAKVAAYMPGASSTVEQKTSVEPPKVGIGGRRSRRRRYRRIKSRIRKRR